MESTEKQGELDSATLARNAAIAQSLRDALAMAGLSENDVVNNFEKIAEHPNTVTEVYEILAQDDKTVDLKEALENHKKADALKQSVDEPEKPTE